MPVQRYLLAKILLVAVVVLLAATVSRMELSNGAR